MELFLNSYQHLLELWRRGISLEKWSSELKRNFKFKEKLFAKKLSIPVSFLSMNIDNQLKREPLEADILSRTYSLNKVMFRNLRQAPLGIS